MEKTLQEKMTERLPQIGNPRASKHFPKELIKTRLATQFIGDGVTGSSTCRYMKMYAGENAANTGQYTKDDIIYVSSNGRRQGRVNPIRNGKLQGEYKNIELAMKVGATFIMDTKAHLIKTQRYNIGEIELAKYMTRNGYRRDEGTGIWKPIIIQGGDLI